jgi:branched-chain amino acid transport system substrate-binding protein
MKRALAWAVLAFIGLGAVPALAQTKPSGEPIKIGGSLGLTGLFAEQAKWVKAGYEAWAEEINQKGGLLGRPVRLIIYEDEGNTDKAITFFERAITVDKVDLILGGYPATVNVAIMPLAEKYGKVYISMGGHLKSFQQGYTYSFGGPPLMAEWIELALAGILDDLTPKADWPKTMALLTMNNVVGLGFRTGLLAAAEKRGIKVVVDEVYNLPLSDATPLVSKARAQRAELLAPLSFFDDGVMITRAAKAMNYNPKLMLHGLAPAIPAWIKELGEDGNNAITFHSWNARLKYPGNDGINEAAKRRFNLPAAPTYMGLGYCWMKTLEAAVQGAGTLDHRKLRDYLRSRAFDFPYGLGIRFDAKGLPQPLGVVTQTTQGRNEVIWPPNQATAKIAFPRPAWTK